MCAMKSLTSARLMSSAAAGSQRAHSRARPAAGYFEADGARIAQDPMSLRCECSDINMPKPANSVTMEVPP